MLPAILPYGWKEGGSRRDERRRVKDPDMEGKDEEGREPQGGREGEREEHEVRDLEGGRGNGGREGKMKEGGGEGGKDFAREFAEKACQCESLRQSENLYVRMYLH